jgi:hypothetical protein
MQPNAYCDRACQHPPTGDGGKKHHFYTGENLVFSSSMMPSSCATRTEEPDDSSTVSSLMRFYISKNPLNFSLGCSLKRAAFPKGTRSIAMHGYLFFSRKFPSFPYPVIHHYHDREMPGGGVRTDHQNHEDEKNSPRVLRSRFIESKNADAFSSCLISDEIRHPPERQKY